MTTLKQLTTELKQSIIEAAEFHERHAEHYRFRAENASPGSYMQKELDQARKYNMGKAKGLREALEYINEFLG